MTQIKKKLSALFCPDAAITARLVSNISDNFAYPLGIENNISNYISNGYYIQANHALKLFFDTIVAASEDEQLFAVWGIVTRLVKLIYEKPDMAVDVRKNLAGKFLSVFDGDFSLEAAKEKTDKAIYELCAYRQPATSGLPTLVIKTKKIVNRYYNNPNLNIAMVGEKLGVSGYYASKCFKKATGMSLAEFICRVRVERAKRLMLDSNLKLSEIARRVGVNDARALNIVFKRIEGMAPSVSRSMSKEN